MFGNRDSDAIALASLSAGFVLGGLALDVGSIVTYILYAMSGLSAFCALLVFASGRNWFRRGPNFQSLDDDPIEPDRWLWQSGYFLAYGEWPSSSVASQSEVEARGVEEFYGAMDRVVKWAAEGRIQAWGVSTKYWSAFHGEIDPDIVALDQIPAEHWRQFELDPSAYFDDPRLGSLSLEAPLGYENSKNEPTHWVAQLVCASQIEQVAQQDGWLPKVGFGRISFLNFVSMALAETGKPTEYDIGIFSRAADVIRQMASDGDIRLFGRDGYSVSALGRASCTGILVEIDRRAWETHSITADFGWAPGCQGNERILAKPLPQEEGEIRGDIHVAAADGVTLSSTAYLLGQKL